MKTHFIEFLKDMFKIPLLTMSTKAFPDHGWRFGIPKAFYITIDDTDFIDKLGKNSLIYSYNKAIYTAEHWAPKDRTVLVPAVLGDVRGR